MVEYQRRCEGGCGQYFEPHNGVKVCPACKKTPKSKRMVNNPKGVNKHTKDKTVVVAKPEILKNIKKEDIQEAYREMIKAMAVYKGKASRFGRLQNAYFGFSGIRKEVKELE